MWVCAESRLGFAKVKTLVVPHVFHSLSFSGPQPSIWHLLSSTSFTRYLSIVLFHVTCYPQHLFLIIFQRFSSVYLAPVVLHVFHSLYFGAPLLFVWHLLSSAFFTFYNSVVLFLVWYLLHPTFFMQSFSCPVLLAPVVLHVFHSLSPCGPLLYVWHLLSTTSFTRYLSVVLFPMSGTCCPPRFSLVCSSTRCLPHHFLSYHPSVQSTLSNLSHARFHLLSSILDIIFSSAFTLFQLGSDKPYTYWPRSLVILPTLQTD